MMFPWEFIENIFIKRLLTFISIAVIFLSGCSGKSQIKVEFPDFENSALLIQHMQNDVVKEGGYLDYLPLNYIQSTIPNIKNIILTARDQGRPVIYSYLSVKDDYSDALFLYSKYPDITERGFFIENTWGAQIIDELTPGEKEITIKDKGYNSFFNGKLDKVLRRLKINTIIIIGVHTNTCVFCTAAGALENGYQVVIVEDATASISEEAHEAAIDVLGSSFATIYSSEYVMLKLKHLYK
ncbi:MAG: cysteine hydrolase [Desulfobacteraceae bacterium]|nr:cysteine hydrolase [Desulfobacteraceae bacterium]